MAARPLPRRARGASGSAGRWSLPSSPTTPARLRVRDCVLRRSVGARRSRLGGPLEGVPSPRAGRWALDRPAVDVTTGRRAIRRRGPGACVRNGRAPDHASVHRAARRRRARKPPRRRLRLRGRLCRCRAARIRSRHRSRSRRGCRRGRCRDGTSERRRDRRSSRRCAARRAAPYGRPRGEHRARRRRAAPRASTSDALR